MELFNWIGDPNAWVSLVTLTFLEIVLGIDNHFHFDSCWEIAQCPTRERPNNRSRFGVSHPDPAALKHQMVDGTDETSRNHFHTHF
jgi:hypothetical protein